eukprot:Skav204727  [mRNA]  locus=scaffold1549:240854:241366:+ [translate_table: standard]
MIFAAALCLQQSLASRHFSDISVHNGTKVDDLEPMSDDVIKRSDSFEPMEDDLEPMSDDVIKRSDSFEPMEDDLEPMSDDAIKRSDSFEAIEPEPVTPKMGSKIEEMIEEEPLSHLSPKVDEVSEPLCGGASVHWKTCGTRSGCKYVKKADAASCGVDAWGCYDETTLTC